MHNRNPNRQGPKKCYVGIQNFSERALKLCERELERRTLKIAERKRKLALIFALKVMLFFRQKWHAKSMVLFRIFLKFHGI